MPLGLSMCLPSSGSLLSMGRACSVLGFENRTMGRRKFLHNLRAIRNFGGIRISVNDVQSLFKCIITATEPSVYSQFFPLNVKD